MGRVAWHWKREFERRGYDFIHIGSKQVGPLAHPGLFPYAAHRVYRKLGRPAALLLTHEPASGAFSSRYASTVVFSHGVERRSWQLALSGADGARERVRRRTRVLYPLWRLRHCDLGLRRAQKLLLINREDAAFTRQFYKRGPGTVHVFRNGVYPSTLDERTQPEEQAVLFLGAWLERKGIGTLVEAARILQERGVRPRWRLAGTGVGREGVLSSWPQSLHESVEVIPNFKRESEESLLASASVFVLPSYFEGQPLALLQAMEAGRCCITTNCCGQRDLITHGRNGLLHESGHARQLASYIEECLRDERRRVSLGKNAKYSVKGRTWESVSSEVADFVGCAPQSLATR